MDYKNGKVLLALVRFSAQKFPGNLSPIQVLHAIGARLHGVATAGKSDSPEKDTLRWC